MTIPDIRISGDHAVTVRMGDEISPEVNRQVLMLKAALEKRPVDGVTETVPTYAALMIHYRPEVIRYGALAEAVLDRARNMEALPEHGKRIVEVPVCYGGEYGPDLEYCAELEHTTTDEIIRKHLTHDYYVYMLGFAPGHPYSARFKEPFSFKRRDTARVRIPARSVVVQQNLSDLIPFDQPCGWNIIGMTPCEICDYNRPDPFLVHAGEWVRYRAVTPDEFTRIRGQVEAGTYQTRVITEQESTDG